MGLTRQERNFLRGRGVGISADFREDDVTAPDRAALRAAGIAVGAVPESGDEGEELNTTEREQLRDAGIEIDAGNPNGKDIVCTVAGQDNPLGTAAKGASRNVTNTSDGNQTVSWLNQREEPVTFVLVPGAKVWFSVIGINTRPKTYRWPDSS